MLQHENITLEQINERFEFHTGERHVIDYEQFKQMINKLPKRKAYGVRDIPNESLIYAPLSLLQILLKVFQIMFDTGFIPTQMGSSTLIPIPKVPQPSGMTEYRPISLLFTLRKCYENYLNMSIKIKLPHNQFGFNTSSNRLQVSEIRVK
eukprot:NODE_1261_length_1562_cov_0.888585.p1 type:complete len:150 gc:universal NODE_1261_length_1562_cov_0.888585:1134-685(-)